MLSIHARALRAVRIRCLVIIVLAAALTGCGFADPDSDTTGDGTLPSVIDPPDQGDDPTHENQAPVADAGPDQSVYEGEQVSLDGSSSSDPDGDSISFSWAPVGATFEIQNAETAVALFAAPEVDSDTLIEITLTVSDQDLESVDAVRVLVRNRSNLASPHADAGPDQSVLPGEPVQLDGRGSAGGDPLEFEWTQTAGTAVTLSDPSAPTPTFIAPSTAGPLVFGLTVHSAGVADTDEVIVVVEALSPAPEPTPGPDPEPTDHCPADPDKTDPGVCGCGVADSDDDADGVPNCIDGCPLHPAKTSPGTCGCAVAETDSDGDGTPNCVDGCPDDPDKTSSGTCGCGMADTDTDGDSVADCVDGCPNDPSASDPSDCAAVEGGDEQTDWDLVMLRLVNRARIDPAGEASRLGSSVADTRAPVPPLAYVREVGSSATNHNTWMHLNLGGIASGRAPDSFTHYETLDGNSSGTPATSTPGYTGVTVGARLTAAGMSWGSVGENILTAYSSNPITVNEAKMVANHRAWWDSSGHRNNLLSTSYTAFGHRVESRSFIPPLGGLSAPVDNLHFATENFARPLSTPRTYIFGVLYEDADGNGAWTPRDVGDPSREGLAGVNFTVRLAGTATIVAGDTTMENGAFSARVGDGSYDVQFTGSSLPGGSLTLSGVVVSGANVDVGDWDVGP